MSVFHPSRRSIRHLLGLGLALVLVLGLATEIQARGRGGGGGGGGGAYRGGGGGSRGGFSRGGPAQGGSIRNERAGGGYRSYERPSGRSSASGSFENRRGETIDYSGSVSRTDDGFKREGSWSSTSGASGGGSSEVRVKDGQVDSVDRSRHIESADGETATREVRSERQGDQVYREGRVKSSTGIDAESKGTIKKTDDGFIARGGVVGKEGAAGGKVVRKGDRTWVRGAATDGRYVTWGGARCTSSRCYGGRVVVDRRDYYRYPYYYYPYYYGWYSCPYGTVQTWYSRYGTPVYGCSNVVVVQTTISMGSQWASSSSGTGGWPQEAQVSSAPVLMYEASDDVVVYATTYEPANVYSVKYGDRYYWTPGPADESGDARQWAESASAMDQPTANSTVIAYSIDGRTVYLTNERPAPGFFYQSVDELFAWIPGVTTPTAEEKRLIDDVARAHRSGGKDALNREVRKLEQGREPPPSGGDIESP